MNDMYLHIESHMRAMMIEQIMARLGRASSNPRSYRRTLESYETTTLRRIYSELFPAQPSLTETAGVIASTDTGHAPGSARDPLTTEPALP